MGDVYIDRAYKCCKGPRKGTLITVTEKCASEGGDPEDDDRYVLEGEDGGSWTIAGETLRRKFGPEGGRTCACEIVGEPVMLEPDGAEANAEAKPARGRRRGGSRRNPDPEAENAQTPVTAEDGASAEAQADESTPSDAAPGPPPAGAPGLTQYGFNW